jgi:hypothetical protein
MMNAMSRTKAKEATGAAVITGSAEACGALSEFREHQKIFSWLIIHAAELPTLPGILFTRWNDEVSTAVERFAGRWDSGKLLVRSDAPRETGLAPRGGYLVRTEEVQGAIAPLLSAGRAVFLLEPVSPLDDLYSLSLAPEPGWREWLLEIVGAGFDASDLKRGDVTPHETVSLRLVDGNVRVLDRALASPAAQAAARAVKSRDVV